MRRTAEVDLAEFENYFSINASAENTSLENVSVDFITAATAFHWFNKEAFKSECKRILKDNGKVVIIFNNRDNEHEIVKKDYIIREKYSVGDKKGLGRGFTKNAVNNFFLDNAFEYKTFRNDLLFDKKSFIGRNLSTSYAPKEAADPEKYHGLVRELGEFFDEYSSNGVLLFPHFSMCFIGKV
jgi:SAM-dependent methyltransferase